MRTITVPDSDSFTAPEIVMACDLPPRSFVYLKREGLCPEASVGGGRGKTAMYDLDGLAYFAALGALHTATGSLTIAARIALSILDGWKRIYGRLPLGEEGLQRMAKKAGLSDQFVWDDDRINPYWVHHSLRSGATDYTPYTAISNDLKIVIVDGKWVFSLGDERVQKMPEPEMKIQKIIRGTSRDADVKTFEDVFCFKGEAAAEIEHARYDAAYANAVSIVRINLSLAIRNALDRIFDRRLSLGSEGHA